MAMQVIAVVITSSPFSIPDKIPAKCKAEVPLFVSDVFLFPSLTEALGTPILEAQACGIPVIANHLKDVVEDLIDCSKGGYYLDLNVEKWIEKIDEAIKIPKKKLLENSIYIKSICSHEVIDKNYINKMKNLIKKNA